MSAFIQANTNGELHPATSPSIAPLNRGFLYGDAIYEVWRTYEGVIFAWEEHWARLERSAAALFLDLPTTRAEILSEIRRTVSAFRKESGSSSDLYIRLQITRGGGPIGLDTALADRSDYVILVQENKLYSESKYAEGLRLSVARALRRNHPDALNPAWKTGNYLNNLLCLREARARGADEVVILNQKNEVTEVAVSNIAFVRDGVVHTPAKACGLLPGITREALLTHVAPLAGVKVLETSILHTELASMSECFLLSTTKDITPVSAIDEQRYAVGEGTVTAKLKRAFAEYVRQYNSRNAALKV